jgi:regulator of protease activity HflC (stomatin/prohibitin superfamily)
MFDKLIDFLLNLKDELIPVRIINEWEGGIQMRGGKFLREVKPGIRFKFPFIDHIWTAYTVAQTVDLSPQTLTTKDGKNIVLKGIIRYKVSDCKKYLMSVNSAKDVLVDTVQGIIREIIEDYTWGSDIELNDLITEKSASVVEVWGIKVESVTLVDFGIIRTYRLMSDLKV